MSANPARGVARHGCLAWFFVSVLLASGLHAETGPVRFSVPDRTLIYEYGLMQRAVPVLLAIRPERTAAAVARLEKRGARIIGRRDAIGYLYAQVPFDSIAEVLELQGLQAVQVAVNPVRGQTDLPPAAAESSSNAGTVRESSRGLPPSPAMAADNPYTGEAATQARAFKAEHPGFDGRGVNIGYVEPVAPNLQTLRGALDISGHELPKFAGYSQGAPLDVADAVADGLHIWQRTEVVYPDASGAFTWREQKYRLPAQSIDSRNLSRQWRMCRRLRAEYEIPQRVPDGSAQAERYHDVLWSVNEQRVWVLPASAGTDFSSARSIDLRSVPASVDLGETGDWKKSSSMPRAFVFNADRKHHWLGFAYAYAVHPGMVGSVMAGSSFLGSRADGIAPAAQLSIFNGTNPDYAASYGSIEQMLLLLEDPRVDVAEASRAVGDTARFGAQTVYRYWTDRLMAGTGIAFAKAANNHGARLYGIQEFGEADDVFAVGAYTPRATWKANFGIDLRAEDTLASYSGYGPAKDGGLKPDFLALTHTLAEAYGDRKFYWADAPGLEEYGVSGGTSAAAPNAAGHLALLVSAAKQSGLPHDRARLRAAIATTAKFIEGYEARAQGHGLIQTEDAWAALQRAKNWKPASFIVQAPLVAAENRAGGAEKFAGRGLFELSGWRPGQSGRRELTVTRTRGSASDDRYVLRWKGHTRAFSSPLQEVRLPLGKPVRIPVEIAVSTSGSYSAILDLVDPGVDLVAGSVLCTVMVADALSPDGLSYARQTPRIGNTVFYVDVPEGLSAITAKFALNSELSYFRVQDPTGRDAPLNPYGSEIYRAPSPDDKTPQKEIVYPDPVPGVWQFMLNNAEPRSREQLVSVADWNEPIPFELQIRGWKMAKDASGLSSLPEARFESRFGALPGTIKAIGLGATRTADVALAPGLEPASFDLTVEPGTARFEVALEQSAAEAHIGLYVYKIPEGERLPRTLNHSDDTALIYYDPSFQPDKHYALAAPAAGRYRIVLDPVDVPARGVNVRYRDTVFHSLYGSIDTTDTASAQHPDVRTARVNVQVRARPADGRELIAEMGLFDDAAQGESSPVAIQRLSLLPGPQP
ncbi:MAG: S8 family serine peptidase [Gammaproteobacteria bacterium]